MFAVLVGSTHGSVLEGRISALDFAVATAYNKRNSVFVTLGIRQLRLEGGESISVIRRSRIGASEPGRIET